MRIYNVTAATPALIGTSESCRSVGATQQITQTRSHVQGRLTVAVPTTYQIEHQCTSTQATVGLGQPTGIALTDEVYTMITIWKIT